MIFKIHPKPPFLTTLKKGIKPVPTVVTLPSDPHYLGPGAPAMSDLYISFLSPNLFYIPILTTLQVESNLNLRLI